MKLSELMTDKTPNPAYTGPLVAEDKKLFIDFTGTADDGDYIAAHRGVTSVGGSISEKKSTKNYFSGQEDVRQGATRAFTVTGDVISGDDFHKALLDYSKLYGTGSEVEANYIYFNVLTGEGERGKLTISVTEDAGGNAQDSMTFSASMASIGKPDKYTYSTTI